MAADVGDGFAATDAALELRPYAASLATWSQADRLSFRPIGTVTSIK